VPVYEGYTVPTAVKRIDLAGRDLTEWMMQLLNDEQTVRVFSTTADREVARHIKEQSGIVSLDFEKDMEEAAEQDEEGGGDSHKQEVKLPDGTSFKVGKARFCCPELMFKPNIGDKSCRSVQDTVDQCIKLCPIDCRRTLLSNIVLSGGTTMFKNFDTRLRNEVMALVPQRGRDDVRVIAMPERKYSVWMGAAIVSSLASFANEWVTKADWMEQGPQALHRRCQSHGSFVAQ
jgi:actin